MIEEEFYKRIKILEAGYKAIDRNKDRLMLEMEKILQEEIITSKITGAKEKEKEEWQKLDEIFEKLKNIWDNQLELQCQIAKEYSVNKKIPVEKRKDQNWEIYIQ